jgi:hypothetical protein
MLMMKNDFNVATTTDPIHAVRAKMGIDLVVTVVLSYVVRCINLRCVARSAIEHDFCNPNDVMKL